MHKICVVIGLATVIIIVVSVQHSSASNILGIISAPGRSNYIIHSSLLQALADRGHNVSHNIPAKLKLYIY